MPRRMAGFDAWDIVKVPFPYTNRPVLQHRPALVVGWHKAAGSPVLLWVLMITRADHRRWEGDVEISTLSSTGLPVRSIVRCAKIATVETSEAAVIGHLPPPDRPAVRDQVAASLSRMLGTPPA